MKYACVHVYICMDMYVYMHAKMNQTSQRLHPLDLVSFISMEDGFDGFLISFLIFHNDKVFVGFAL